MDKKYFKKFLWKFAILILFSCNRNPDQKKIENNFGKEDLLVSQFQKQNEFALIINPDSINLKSGQMLNGSWRVTNNPSISLFQTPINYNDSIVFKDSTEIAMTGWGCIRYNRVIKIYQNKYSRDIYEYYANNNNQLVLANFVYRRNNLKISDTINVKYLFIDYTELDPNLISLTLNDRKILLERIE